MGKVTSNPKPAWAIAFKERREEVVGSQEEMALRANISQSLVSQIERGVQNPVSVSVERFGRILQVLQWTTEEFSEVTGIDVVPIFSLPDSAAQFSADALYDAVPDAEPDVPAELLEAAELYGDSPEFAGLREPRWQYWLATAPHKSRPTTASGWLAFYNSVKDTIEP